MLSVDHHKLSFEICIYGERGGVHKYRTQADKQYKSGAYKIGLIVHELLNLKPSWIVKLIVKAS